ncbi:Gmad2 immunoglobulin-like domain-containing protein [Nocardioides astragali]|uniref:Gmad2 immunoglobulin-like domain-containing protein n=1 Tax=Nocardioides astragali TaxID=1776736 RepID=A0ABW2N2W8_9ACTN|nr:Gmad2 immunoglobulin-like domain-containing protein [Nocardioides astragali]
MSDDPVREMLREVADGVEPGDRLDAIRSATSGGRRTSRGWWATGGVALVAASVVTALALTTGGTPRSEDPDPAEPTPTRTTATNGPRPEQEPRARPVYYLGDTPDGPRLYREFRPLAGDPLQVAVDAAIGRGQDDRSLAPLDPDYWVPWPETTWAGAIVDYDEGVIEISLAASPFAGDPETDLRSRGTLSQAEAELAVEQVIRTAQAAVQERLPVRFLLYNEITDQVLGVPTSEPLAEGSDLEVLAHVSLSDPSDGATVDNDDPFTVKGLGNSYEGNIVTEIQRHEGVVEIVQMEPAIAGTYEDKLFPFEVTFDLTDVPPGDYLVTSRTDDPSGEARFHTDSRRITIVD